MSRASLAGAGGAALLYGKRLQAPQEDSDHRRVELLAEIGLHDPVDEESVSHEGQHRRDLFVWQRRRDAEAVLPALENLGQPLPHSPKACGQLLPKLLVASGVGDELEVEGPELVTAGEVDEI